MSMPVILRLVEAPLLRGDVVGEAEIVETGEVALVRSVEELVEFLRGSSRMGGPLLSEEAPAERHAQAVEPSPIADGR